MPFSRTKFHGRMKPFSEEFQNDLREMADTVGVLAEIFPEIIRKVREPDQAKSAAVSSGRVKVTWAVINATRSGSVITTGVAPTSLGNGIFEYKAVPVKITGYSAGAFTYAVDDDAEFAPAAYGDAASVTLLNAPTHENDADWKYAGVNTSAGSSYPAGFDVRGIGEKLDTGGGASTWVSTLVLIGKYAVDAETSLWLLMAEPDHDGECTAGGATGGTDLGLSTAIANGSF